MGCLPIFNALISFHETSEYEPGPMTRLPRVPIFESLKGHQMTKEMKVLILGFEGSISDRGFYLFEKLLDPHRYSAYLRREPTTFGICCTHILALL
jgi:hypothetical protein